MWMLKKQLFDLYNTIDHPGEESLRSWRKKICDVVFYFFAIFGLFTVIPSMLLSLREGYYFIALIDVLLYLSCLFFVFNRWIPYLVKAYAGTVLYYLVGLAMLLILGPLGASDIWMFTVVMLTGFMIGNTAAIVAFLINALTHLGIFFLLSSGMLTWQARFGISADAWGVKSLNYILLNLIILVATIVFTNGFSNLISRSNNTRNASILGLAKLAEFRDNDTGQHLIRIQKLSAMIATQLAKRSAYSKYITPDYINDLYISSILHDIGKVGINDSILLKPGPLTPEEFLIIKQHPQIGAEVISEIDKHIEGRSFYSLGREIALYHHEKWDGSGYPEGLKGKDIPLSARITALADVYDALISMRPYKTPSSHEDAVKIICDGRGSHFDPDIVDAFLEIADDFK